jgi:hypothetical protein
MTSAWLAGADPVPQAAPAPAPAAAAPAPAPAAVAIGGCNGCSSGCGNYAACGCSCESTGLLSRIKARFSHHNDCCDTCSSYAPASTHHAWGYSGCSGSCGAVSSCDSCCESGGFFARLRARFHHGNDCGCDTGCATGCSSCGNALAPAPAMVAPKPAGEPIKAPKEGGEPIKKMPEGAKPEAKPTDKEARVPAILEVTPTTSRIIETGTRSPY